MIAALVLASALAAAPDPEIGRRIYLDGVLSSGEPIRGTIQGDVAVEGAAFACASCHRRSGFGEGEGGAYVPPITSKALFQPREPDRADLFRDLYQEVHPATVAARVRDPRLRPAYTPESLAVLLREGRDPSGREIDPLMPRYRLGEENTAHLVAYLETLAATDSPGVDAERIRFATVVTEGVDPADRQAMLDVMAAYVRRKNLDTQGELAHPGHSPWHRDDLRRSYREWVLDVWELSGPPETWGGELDSLYRKEPVFALLGGLGAGDWRPIHDFCERAGVPCLFPNTDLPVVSPAGVYTLYFSEGLTLEAEALARYLRDAPEPPEKVVQVYRETGKGAVAAQAFRRAFGETEERPVVTSVRETLREVEAGVLVLWLEGPDVAAMGDLPGSVREVYLSYGLLGETSPGEASIATLPACWRDRVRLTYPFVLPGHETPRIFRVRAWMHARGIERRNERLQLKTFFALSVADHALGHLVERFSRDYFVESVEHEAENGLDPGVFPRLALGPGQRFASKGCYVVKLSEEAEGGIAPVSGWIVP